MPLLAEPWPEKALLPPRALSAVIQRQEARVPGKHLCRPGASAGVAHPRPPQGPSQISAPQPVLQERGASQPTQPPRSSTLPTPILWEPFPKPLM